MNNRNLNHFLDLTLVLTSKELKGRYKSTTLGFLWILVNPFLQMVVLTIVFSFFLKIDIKNYPLFVFSGLLPWMFFSLSLSTGTSSLINNRDLIKKTFFPREILPLSSVLAHLFTFLMAISFLIFVTIFITGFSFNFILLIPLIILEAVLVFAIALLLSSLDIYYRDVTHLLNASMILWFYLTPIFYSLDFVPKNYLLIYQLNPMVGITTAYQAIFLNTNLTTLTPLAISVIETILLLIIGLFIFKRRAKYFADWV